MIFRVLYTDFYMKYLIGAMLAFLVAMFVAEFAVKSFLAATSPAVHATKRAAIINLVLGQNE